MAPFISYGMRCSSQSVESNHANHSCALAVQARLEAASFEAHPMTTRVAVSSGEVTAMHLGGARERWEFIVTGAPLADLGTVKYLARPGHVVVSESVWELIEPIGQGELLEKGAVELVAIARPHPGGAPARTGRRATGRAVQYTC